MSKLVLKEKNDIDLIFINPLKLSTKTHLKIQMFTKMKYSQNLRYAQDKRGHKKWSLRPGF